MITPDTISLAMFGPIGMPELIILAFLGLLIFGKRLPEIGKGLGKGIISFKKGLQGVQDDIEDSVNRADKEEPRKLDAKPATKETATAGVKDESRAL